MHAFPMPAVGCAVGETAGGAGGGSPLHYAVSGEHVECVQTMLHYHPTAVNSTVPGEQVCSGIDSRTTVHTGFHWLSYLWFKYIIPLPSHFIFP